MTTTCSTSRRRRQTDRHSAKIQHRNRGRTHTFAPPPLGFSSVRRGIRSRSFSIIKLSNIDKIIQLNNSNEQRPLSSSFSSSSSTSSHYHHSAFSLPLSLRRHILIILTYCTIRRSLSSLLCSAISTSMTFFCNK